ncbi:hypothetical protein HK096_009987 [Nowakowskiella sp. JEL0078]|nr:hypothetical protein HK096_009987 [Nowakowskiella sp. JEL0078]
MTEAKWFDKYPKVVSSPEKWSAEEVANLLLNENKESFLVVDVRRTDYGGGHVRGSINSPAQGNFFAPILLQFKQATAFWDNLDEFIAKYSHIPKIFFYCNSSSGRGPRCAGWYQDALNERGITTSQGLVLAGGIKGWIEKFSEDENLTEEYNEEWWKSEH